MTFTLRLDDREHKLLIQALTYGLTAGSPGFEILDTEDPLSDVLERLKKGKEQKDQKILDRWYRQNPDDAGEYQIDDIIARFGVSPEMAEAMYKRIQKDRYGDRS